MNILYISCLDGRPWAGPTYSVPKQIEAQSKVDCVFWYNLIEEKNTEWKECIVKWREFCFYSDLDDYPYERIELLPEPFDRPDLVIVEQFYPFAKKNIFFSILKNKVNYVIIPRGEFTVSAQSQKRLKKSIANVLFFYWFAKRAKAIQFLTEEEKRTTSKIWNNTSIVMPNGTEANELIERKYSKDKIRCVFIGRIAVYHKGIDLLIDACEQIKDILIDENVRIDIYGPDREKKVASLENDIMKKKLSEVIRFHDGVYGDEKKSILRTSDVFIITSRFEGHPTALLDALGFGLPAIATTGSNMRREIDEKKAGWTADNTVEGIRDAFLSMIKEKERIPQKGLNARALAYEYSWEKLAKKNSEIYHKLLLKG